MLTLNEQDIKQLNHFLQEMPLKHGLPLLNFFNDLIKKQETSKQENISVESVVEE